MPRPADASPDKGREVGLVALFQQRVEQNGCRGDIRFVVDRRRAEVLGIEIETKAITRLDFGPQGNVLPAIADDTAKVRKFI